MSFKNLPATLHCTDKIWDEIRNETLQVTTTETVLANKLNILILEKNSFSEALAAIMAYSIHNTLIANQDLLGIFLEILGADDSITNSAIDDLIAVRQRDPACSSYLHPLLFFKGYQALQLYRIAHALWQKSRFELGFELQSQSSKLFGVDIHPAARLGSGILIDHATSVVIGETAVVEDNVSILHEVTLGGNGKERGDRHPKIRSGVLIGAGAKVLGNIEVGTCSIIAACSVVLQNVPAHTTVAGVPAKVIGEARQAEPASAMDHQLEGS
jgi:serine O-acetyltransferase